MNAARLWLSFIAVIVISFSVLVYFGLEIYKQAPPIPDKVVSVHGQLIWTSQEIRDGQNVWQSIGGEEVGTIWGHGSYIAPDWSADWLHKEALHILFDWSKQEFGARYDSLDDERKAVLQVRLQKELRTNTYDESIRVLTVSEVRLNAIKSNSEYYTSLFMSDPQFAKQRTAYAIPENAVKNPERMSKLNAFFFWTAWACVTNRPQSATTYTNNWPPDELVGNKPTGSMILWTGFSVVMLLIGIGLLSYHYAKSKTDEKDSTFLPKKDPLLGLEATASMKATLKFFWVVSAMILAQVLFGVVTAHYGVEGNGFYGINLSTVIPYAVSRTWHVQLAIFWIATSWLATGLYIAPAVSGFEPKFQRAGTNFLFSALLVIVLGSMAGEWFGVMQKLGFVTNFWFGHQGYEYVDLGRFWQAFLFLGLIVWLFLMVRALLPALKKPSESRQLYLLFLIASIAITLLYGAGLMWGRQTNLTVAEYWRWWVVHLWVEGFFEVFATVVSAFLFVRMGLLKIKFVTSNVLFSTIIYLTGGIIGTFHHLYFAGTPAAVMGIGATFSALEVVPLVFMGFEAYHNLKLSRTTQWVISYKWPIYCFISVAFWNLIGAGIFGFLINPPIALFYMQGLHMTPVHGHTALFGVYGMLGIGLMLFVMRGLTGKYRWKDGVIQFAFWSLNIGLLLMVLLSMIPIGFAQTVASVQYGMWYARSSEFLQSAPLDTFRWLRVIGDTIFAIGSVALAWFVIGLKTGWSIDRTITDVSDQHFPGVYTETD